MALVAENVARLSPDFLGAGIIRILAGNMVAGGLFLLVMSVALHLIVTKVGWWEGAPAVSRIAGVGLFLVVGGLVIGHPAGGADLEPIWLFVRLAAYGIVGIVGVVLVGAALVLGAGRVRSGR